MRPPLHRLTRLDTLHTVPKMLSIGFVVGRVSRSLPVISRSIPPALEPVETT